MSFISGFTLSSENESSQDFLFRHRRTYPDEYSPGQMHQPARLRLKTIYRDIWLSDCVIILAIFRRFGV